MRKALSVEVRQTIQSAAKKLTGYARRQFQAEVAAQYCGGSARRAEQLFGWGREAVRTGLHELRSGIRCLEDYSSHGRPRSEQRHPELAKQIHAMAEPETQADPKFQTPLAFTRITAQAVHARLLIEAQGTSRPVPAKRTVHDILHRLGYRLRRVRKTKPQKKSLRPTLSLTT